MQKMNDFTAEKFIAKLLGLYAIGERDEEKLYAGRDMLETAFGGYAWGDVERALEWFYQNKNDKTRPTIARLKHTMGELGIERIDGVVEKTENPFARPTTKIWAIQADFDKMIQIFIDGGVIPDENGRVHNIRSIIDPITDLPVLSPLSWFTWKLCAVRETRPDLFARFPHANTLEQLAIALGNKLIPFKVRDWAKLAADLRAKNGGKMPRSAINLSMGAM